MEFNELTARQVRALADAHIHEFEKKIRAGEAGSKYVNVEECQRYLRIWKSTQEKAQKEDWKHRLSLTEVNEIKDALFDGGYDDLLKASSDN
jgi:hypothetical protein